VVGRLFAFRGTPAHPIAIAGVVKDARDGGVKRPTQRMAYLAFGQGAVHTVIFSVRIDTVAATVSQAVRRTLEHVDPAVGVERITAADAQLDQALQRERLLATLGAAFSALALLLCAIGLYGMLNAMVVRRTAEIGVRMALGAARSRIAWMFARETIT